MMAALCEHDRRDGPAGRRAHWTTFALRAPVFALGTALRAHAGVESATDSTSLLDFWCWALGDLHPEDLNAVFAQWIVCRLLGVEPKHRMSRALTDVVLQDGTRVEVQATAYWGSAAPMGGFGRRLEAMVDPMAGPGRAGYDDSSANGARVAVFAAPRIAECDVHVFALQNERDPGRWNGMDLAQWEFYVLPSTALELWEQRPVPLSRLRQRSRRLRHDELRFEVLRAARTARADRQYAYEPAVPAY